MPQYRQSFLQKLDTSMSPRVNTFVPYTCLRTASARLASSRAVPGVRCAMSRSYSPSESERVRHSLVDEEREPLIGFTAM